MEKPHVVMLQVSSPGHINPSLKLAKVLHSKGFFITFINTESGKESILRSQGPDALQGLKDFQFETIPDGLELSSSRSTQRVVSGKLLTYENCIVPLRDLLRRLNSTSGVPKVTCLVYNWLMTFALDVAEELSIPALVFCTMSACGFMGCYQLDELIQRGYTPLKDESCLTNGYLDTSIDWIPGMKNIRLKDLSSFIRTVDAEDYFLNCDRIATKKAHRANGLILNTFDLLETDVLNAIQSLFHNVYAIGPLPTLLDQFAESPTSSMRLNLREDDQGYKKWLNEQPTSSVVYVNFGSLATVTPKQLIEFAWGLANSNHPFLWVIRPDLVNGDDHAILLEEFIKETKDRCYIASWCSQEEVLSHSSVGVFLTHSGWNSTLDSICCGVPMICWPGFAEQHTNARYVCKEWGMGLEIESDVKRDEVTSIVKEMMQREEMRKNALKWKEKAKEATMQGGSSYKNLERMIEDLHLMRMGSAHPNASG